jgi:hypothetical protein
MIGYRTMDLSKYVNMKIMLISLVIGLFAVYITMPDRRMIYVYPTPESAALIQYKDKTDTCFSVKQSEVSCPANKNDIAKIPVQA